MTAITSFVFLISFVAYVTYPLYYDNLNSPSEIIAKLFIAMTLSGVSMLFCLF